MTTYTDFSRNGIINSRMRSISKLLLYGVLTRKELSRELGVSIATATNHTQDLLANEILLSEIIPGVNSKRPIQKLYLNGQQGMCAAIILDPKTITVELVSLDSTLVETGKVPVKSATQADVLAALEQAAIKVEAMAKARGYSIISGLIGVHGTLSPSTKAIFSVDGIPDWEPSSPVDFLKYFVNDPIYELSTWIMAKCKGFSREQQCDNHIGLIEFKNNTFHVAVIYNEQIEFGHLGTSSPFLHCGIKDGLPCYCGRNNCFSSYIKNGGCEPTVINEGLNKIFEKVPISLVGLEFAEQPQISEQVYADGLNAKPVMVKNGHELYLDGLRMLAAENAWKRILMKLFADKK